MNNKLVLALLGVAAAGILGLAAVLLVVVAGGGDKDDSGDQPRAESTEEPADGADGDSAGTLRIRGTDPLGLDPAVIQDASSGFYVVEIFSGLVRIDRDLRVQPDLAESWDVSSDGKVYTFHLNEDATFQDGRPVSAEDVQYSFERALNPDTASIVAENFLGDIVGARDLSRGRAESVSGIKIINDTTIELTIDAPKAYFLFKLTYPTGFVVDRRQVEANPRNWTRKPNGTGPYKLKKWELGEEIVLEAYDKHHLGAPKLKTVRIGLSGGSALVAYQDGDIDVTGVGLDDLASIQDPSNELNDEYVQSSQQSISYMAFNTGVEPFDDPKVRQAFALAVDRKKIAEVVYENAIPVATGIIMPGVHGYTAEDKTYPYDPDRARQLLSESKYAGNVPPITLADIGAGAEVDAPTEAIIQAWKDELGVDVQIEQAETATFFADLDAGRYQMFQLGWIMDYPDPEDVLDVLFHSKSRQNNTRYTNLELDAKLEAARIEPDTERRLAMYREIEKELIDQAVWVPLYFTTVHALIKPYVKNYAIPPAVIERFRDVEIDR